MAAAATAATAIVPIGVEGAAEPLRGAAVKRGGAWAGGPLRDSAVKPSSLGGPLRGAAVKTSIGQRVRQTPSKPRRPPGPYYPPQCGADKN